VPDRSNVHSRLRDCGVVDNRPLMTFGNRRRAVEPRLVAYDRLSHSNDRIAWPTPLLWVSVEVTTGLSQKVVETMASEEPPAPRLWRTWSDIAELFDGRDDPGWPVDRARIKNHVRDPDSDH
jgi:hypothetical protein